MNTYIVIILAVIIFVVWIWWGIKQLAKGARRINEEMEIERNKEPDPNVVMADPTSAIARNILIGLIAFAFINGVLYISQERYHRADVQRCEDLANHLEQMKGNIDAFEQNLKMNLKQKQEIERLERQLQDRRKYYETEVAYNEDHHRYEKLIGDYNKDIEEYKRMIDRYNSDVVEYNKTAKSAYSRWYIIPFRGARGKSFSPIH